MGCSNCGQKTLARNNAPLYPDSDLYPFSLEGEASLVRGKTEEGELVPFIMSRNLGCSPVNPEGCKFTGKKLVNYGPYDYPAWVL